VGDREWARLTDSVEKLGAGEELAALDRGGELAFLTIGRYYRGFRVDPGADLR
jgi:hypothetical protein